jgi:hypothetical protein
LHLVLIVIFRTLPTSVVPCMISIAKRTLQLEVNIGRLALIIHGL